VRKFRQIPWPGRVLIETAAGSVFAFAFLACAASWNAIFRLVSMLGLYNSWVTAFFPGLVDAPFIIAEGAAILGGIMRAVHLGNLSPNLTEEARKREGKKIVKVWPYTTMLLCGVCTMGFNVWHAYLLGGLHDPLTLPRCVVAILPPLFMMASFQVLISIVKWTMLHMGRPLDSAEGLSPTEAVDEQQQIPSPGTDGDWVGPHPYTSTTRLNPQPGQTDSGGLRTERVRTFLRYMRDNEEERFAVATKTSVADELKDRYGLIVDKSWVQRILGEPEFARRAAISGNGNNGSRKRGSEAAR
jgi:hypothetical protein